jgi:hypothetical protein
MALARSPLEMIFVVAPITLLVQPAIGTVMGARLGSHLIFEFEPSKYTTAEILRIAAALEWLRTRKAA